MDKTKWKLEQEKTNLERLKETIKRSSQLTNAMCAILDSSDERLSKLEHAIIPLYTESGTLQLRQEKIETTMETLDYYIQFYNVAKDVEPIIRDGPSTNLENYLEHMDKLNKAQQFFALNNLNPVEYTNLSSMYESGRNALGKEFRLLLTRYSKPVPAILIHDLLEEDDEEKVILEQFPESCLSDLILIANWLENNKNDDYCNVYAAIRSNTTMNSLKGLKDHQKSSSGGSNNLPSPMLGGRKNNKRKNVGIHQVFMKKASAAITNIKYSTAVATESNAQETKDEIQESELETFVTSFSALHRLLESELVIMKGIIPDDQQHKIFSRIVEPSLRMLCTEGDALAQRVKKSAFRQDFQSVLCLFPVLRQLQNIKPDIDELCKDLESNVKDLLKGLIITLQTTINKSLEEFVESIRNDPDTKLPKDGTVHQLTSNVMILLEQLIDYIDMLPTSLSVSDSSLLIGAEDPGKMVLAQYIMRVLSGLGLAIQNKSEAYSDVYLKAIFRLNNLHYITKSLQRTSLLEIVNLFSHNINEYYTDQIRDQKRIYSQSWSRVLHFVLEVDRPISQQRASPSFSQLANMKLKDKDKQSIKDKFTGFNREIEEIYRVQKSYAIPDAELKASLKDNNKEFILPKYQLFYDKYSQIPFTKNHDKYLKFNVQDVASLIDKFFDAAA